MVTFNLKALVVALVFAGVGCIVGIGIRQLISLFFVWDGPTPRWLPLLWLLLPLGLVGGGWLGWWLVVS